MTLKSVAKQLIIPTGDRKYGHFSVFADVLKLIYEQIFFSKYTQQRQIGFFIWEKILIDFGHLLVWNDNNQTIIKDQYVQRYLRNRASTTLKFLFANSKVVSINPDA